MCTVALRPLKIGGNDLFYICCHCDPFDIKSKFLS